MGKSCVYKPTIITKDGQEVESKLFNDLLSLTGNREASKYLWGASQISEFTNDFKDVVRDENGEITIQSLSDNINIKDFVEGKPGLILEKRKIGATNEKDEIINYNSSEEIIDKVINFNLNNENIVADIGRNGSKYIIDVNHKTLENADIPSKIKFSNSLNNHLIGIMRNLGFDAAFNNNMTHDGMFNPLNGEKTYNDLQTVISIVEGKRGEEAFPEEFSHLMIEGLYNHPLVQRLMESLKNESLLKSVLKDEYDTYYNLYNGDMDRLIKEAAGKLLQAEITNQFVPPISKNLISRLWTVIKNMLSKLTQSKLEHAMNQARNDVKDLSSKILDESILPMFDKTLLQNSKPLYKVATDIDKLTEISLKALEVASKKLKIIQSRSKNSKYTEADLQSIKTLQALIEKKKYAQSSLSFLKGSLSEIEKLQKQINHLNDIDSRNESDLSKIRSMSVALRRIKEFADAYTPIINDMVAIRFMQQRGEVELSIEDAQKISDLALKISTILSDLNGTYQKMRFNTVFNFLKIHWGEDKIIELGKKKGSALSLEMMLEMADKDIGGLDRWVSSMSDASDPLLSLIDKVVKKSQATRDNVLIEVMNDLRVAHGKLIAAGYNTDFMYEKDANGKLTGRIISDIDFAKFNKEREDYINKFKSKGLSNYAIQSKLEAWEKRRMASYIIDKDTGRIEILPNKDVYKTDIISKLAPAELEYYNTMMAIKAALDSFIPARYANTYNAVQIRNDMVEGLINNISDPTKAAKMIVQNLKDKFVVRNDNTDYGKVVIEIDEFNDWVINNKIDISTEELKKTAEAEYKIYVGKQSKTIMTDFAGKAVQQLPVYYTQPLENMDRLSTDFTSSMLAYAGMAVNYQEMNKIVDVLELTRDLVKDREVQQMSGNKYLTESFKVANKLFQKAHTKRGEQTNIGGRIDDYYASVIYGQKKKDEGTFKMFGEDISVSQTGDALKSYTSTLGLGLNLFSAISNATMGKMQMFFEAIGGEYYNLKDSAIGKKNYYALLPEYLGELNSIKKTNKLALLIDKFNALEEFHKDLRNKDFYKSPMARILGNTNLMFMHSMGEHYLHVRNMLAMLNAYKVRDKNGKEITLFDAFEIKKDAKGVYEIGGELSLKEGVTKLDGSELTEDDLINIRLRINKVSQSLNGAFNDTDKGAIHKYVLGRLAMQFRQWMPAHYYRRLAKPYYDAQLDQWREGYYRTMGRFAWNTIMDLRRAKFQLATNWSQLNNHEKANIKRGIAELSMFALLAGLISMLGPEKDRKGVWHERMLIYQLKRLRLEVSASIPIHPNIIDNMWTILQSPSASIKSVNNLGNLVEFWNLFNEVESGRYKGWNEYARNAIGSVPYYGQIKKISDITEEDYMFNIFNK